MRKQELTDEIRRITNETAAAATAEALRVSEQAKQKASEVSSLAIAKALDASTLAATRAADAVSAAAAIAASTSKDLEYIKKDISDTKADIKAINDKLDSRYVSKEDFSVSKSELIAHITEDNKMHNEHSTAIRAIELDLSVVKTKMFTWGMAGLLALGVIEFLVNKFS